ncbi:hypothetical protein MM221_05170 [Salipaludibacillus sp. LMS25]|jgi:hypothetical protein|uniref:hypothetical protein n=1 Tax=Salipaludibacillus sp. LMS25 TaxID=2924031 RepID=UPI0020D00F5B|nr:hypothetical protein [Salipaludibacillus sp. LMS25]UTR15952.1 hypothetical protein MM221_05170 [Salipaludibacillus sp. LMS25]
MKTKTTSMEFLHSKLNVISYENINLSSVFDFFSTHFIIKTNNRIENSIANIYISKSNELKYIAFKEGKDIYIRKSVSNFFTIKAKKVNLNGKEYLRIDQTGTIITFNKEKKEIHIHLQGQLEQKDELAIIEVIRDLVLKNEENKEVLILHATCAFKENQASLIIGAKGAGKSTTLLEFVHSANYKFMSGDKTFVWIQNNTVVASGWPDYPHLGLGTISKYPELTDKLELKHKVKSNIEDIWSTKHKIAVSPNIFKQVFPCTPPGLICTVGNIYYPTLYDSDSCEIVRKENRTEFIIPHVESLYKEDGNYWNNFIELSKTDSENNNIINALEKLESYDILGNGIIDDHLITK